MTASSQILYLKDTNGDLEADTKEVLFSGFFDNNSEAQVTCLRFGIDNWIYASNYGSTANVVFNREPTSDTLFLGPKDFRFRLDLGKFEPAAGRSQFGYSMDDWGHRFLTENTQHIRYSVIPARYINRHPYLPSESLMANISDHGLEVYQLTPPPYWRVERTKQRNQLYTEQNLDRTEYAEGHFTGASGGTIYAGDAFPDEYYGNVFTGDVACNIIHRDILGYREDRPTFLAKRSDDEDGAEFLASTDPWFRPVNFTVGPDGYLYVLDMYRQHIETPFSIPEELKVDMDFLNGSQLGRIYRIVPEGKKPDKKVSPDLQDFPKMQEMESHEYVELLAHPNRWWRTQAQRLLLESQDTSVIPSVKALFSESEEARVRLHALYVLEGMNSLNANLIKQAMKDPHVGVREHGIILSERFPELVPQIIESIDDTSIRIAFQATLSMGQFDDKSVVEAFAKVLHRHGQDKWFRTAILSSKPGSSFSLMQTLASPSYDIFNQETKASSANDGESWQAAFMEEFFYVVGLRSQNDQISQLLEMLSQKNTEKSKELVNVAIKGLTHGLKESPIGDEEITKILQDTDNSSMSAVIHELKKYFQVLNDNSF